MERRIGEGATYQVRRESAVDTVHVERMKPYYGPIVVPQHSMDQDCAAVVQAAAEMEERQQQESPTPAEQAHHAGHYRGKVEPDNDESFEVEKVLARREARRNRRIEPVVVEYLVKFKGYEDPEWTELQCMDHCPLAVYDWWKANPQMRPEAATPREKKMFAEALREEATPDS